MGKSWDPHAEKGSLWEDLSNNQILGNGAHPGESFERHGLASNADVDKVSGCTLISEEEDIYAYEWLPCLDSIHLFNKYLLNTICAK